MAEPDEQVILWTSKDIARPLKRSDWPDDVKRIVEVINHNFQDVLVHRSLKVYEGCGKANGRDATEVIVITAEFRVAWTDRPTETRIHNIEPLAFVFSKKSLRWKPPYVFSNRTDFPKDLPHLNLRSQNLPAFLCLSATSLVEEYQAFGIASIVKRSLIWLADASSGDLNKDGWHPILVDETRFHAIVDLSESQAICLEMTTCGSLRKYGLSRFTVINVPNVFNTPELHSYHIIEAMNLDGFPDEREIRRFTTENDQKGLRGEPVPVVMIVVEGEIQEHGLRFVERVEDIFAICEELGSTTKALIETFPVQMFEGGHDRGLVLLAIRRPMPLMPNAFGLSENLEARKFEIRAYEIYVTERRLECLALWHAAELEIMPWPNSKLFLDTSGTPLVSWICLFGFGALGSQFFDFFARTGTDLMLIYDPDVVAPHNLARHIADIRHLSSTKVKVAERISTELGGRPEVLSLPVRGTTVLEDFPDEKLQKISLFIDATANLDMRNYLSTEAVPKSILLVRTEMFDQGRLGVMSVSGEGASPDLEFLHARLRLLALDDIHVSRWLKREARSAATFETIELGMSCASPTVVMPKERIAIHAAAFMPKIREVCSDSTTTISGIGINRLDGDFMPVGWRWVDVITPRSFKPEGAPGWRVRVDQDVIKKMRRLRRNALPCETGGYLYGTWNGLIDVMNVVICTDLPPDSHATPSSLKMGPAGRTNIEHRMKAAAAGGLVLLGTWHSHPGRDAERSARDLREFKKQQRLNRAGGMPTMMLIVAERSLKVYLEE